MTVTERYSIPKARRRQFAKAELLLQVAITVQRWADELTGQSGRILPFEQWPSDDPLRRLAATYDLTAPDLAKICTQIADEMEGRAERAGYGERPDA